MVLKWELTNLTFSVVKYFCKQYNVTIENTLAFSQLHIPQKKHFVIIILFRFVYRSTAKSCDNEVKKTCKKGAGRMRIGHVFRRSISKESTGCLFGLPLSKICEGDNLPRPVMVSLVG